MTSLTASRDSVSEQMPCFVDFQGVAHLIDAISGNAPEHLSMLLRVLSTSGERLEARVVVELVLRCRDPLSPLGSLCREALKTAADLDILLRREHLKLSDIPRISHAGALLNLCDRALQEETPHGKERRRQIRRIRPMVKVLAVAELNNRQEEMAKIRAIRDAVFPNLWNLLETHLARFKGSEQTSFSRA